MGGREREGGGQEKLEGNKNVGGEKERHQNRIKVGTGKITESRFLEPKGKKSQLCHFRA